MAIATILSITGQAWAVNADGQRRELKPGDRLGDDETLITAPGGGIELRFDNGQQLHLDGDQQITMQDALGVTSTNGNEEEATSEEATEEGTAEATPNPLPQSTPPSGDVLQNTGHRAFNILDTGHNFVRLKRIIEPVPELAYHWEVARDEVPEWRQGPGEDEQTRREHEATRTPGVSVELQGAGPDDIYSAEEISPNGTVPALITLDSQVREGDHLRVQDGNGNILIDRPVTAEDLRDGILIDVPVEPGQPVWVEATITTPSGLSGRDSDTKPVDEDIEDGDGNDEGGGEDDENEDETEGGTTPLTPGVTVELQGAGPDGVYNQDEISPDGTVPALVTLDNNVRVGDTLVVTDKNGNTLLNRVVTQEDLDAGIIVKVPVEPGDTDVSVTATITNPAGQSGTDNDEKPVDILPPELVTELPPQADQDADPVDLDLGSYFKDNNPGPLTYEVEGLPPGLSYDPNTGKITGTIDKSGSQGGPGGDGNYPITVTVTDPAGNKTTTTFEWQVDNPPPVANDDEHTIDEDTVGTGNLITGQNSSGTGGGPDNDPDGDELKVTGFTVGDDPTIYQPGTTVDIEDTDGPVGTITIDENGNYTFTPEQDWNGTVPDIGYTITDGEGGEDEAKLTIMVTPVNDPPEAVGTIPDQNDKDADTITTVELDLPSLFQDVDDDELTYSISGLPKGLEFDPLTGEITGTIDNSASQDGENGVHRVVITATDPDRETAEHTFTWTVTNPEPEADNDIGDTLKSTRLTVDAENGVLQNDTDPDGDDLVVQGVIAGGEGGEGGESEEGVDTVITGTYGTLVLQANGSYVYTPDLTNNTVWTLPEDDTLTDTFTYTVSDGEGGTDTAELVITIHGHSNTPPFVTPQDHNDEGTTAIDGHITVHEKGLDDGSDPGEGHTAQGVIQISAMDGLASIKVAGQTYTLEQLEGLMTSGATLGPITVLGGTLTLTGFEPILGTYFDDDPENWAEKTLGGDLHYIYELTDEQTHADADGNNSLVLEIQLGVTDDQEASGDDNKLIVNVIDDVPVAEDDENSVTEGAGIDDESSITSGNVIGGEGATDPSDDDVEDTTGADGATVTAITSNNQSGNTSTEDEDNGALVIDGEYGTLTIHLDGSYTYKLDNSNLDVQGLNEDDEPLQDIFTYTLTDGDGDRSDATLTINIDGSNDEVTITVPNPGDPDDPNYPAVNDPQDPDDPTRGQVDDLVVFESGLSDGSHPDNADIRVESSFTIEALDGLDDEGTALTLAGTNGETLEVTRAQVEALSGNPSDSLETPYGTLTLTGYAKDQVTGVITIEYEYILTSPPDNSDGGDHAFDRISITANDRDGDDDKQTLSIKIVDDAPEAKDDENSVTEGAGINDTSSITTGNVIGSEGATNPADDDVEDTTGADGATVTDITSDNVLGNNATDDGEGVLTIDGQYGTLTIHPDGSYTYVLDNSNLGVQGLHPDDTPFTDVFNYTLTDSDGDDDTATLTINIHGQDDGVTITVPDPNDPDNPLNEDAYPDDPEDGNINDLVVFESGLSIGSSNENGEAVDNLVNVESSFTISALDGLEDNGTALTLAGTNGKTLELPERWSKG